MDHFRNDTGPQTGVCIAMHSEEAAGGRFSALIIMTEYIQQPVIILWIHNAEPYIFSVQAFERRTVPDHEILVNRFLKDIERSESFF